MSAGQRQRRATAGKQDVRAGEANEQVRAGRMKPVQRSDGRQRAIRREVVKQQGARVEADAAAHQQQMVKAGTPRPHPVPGRIERNAHATRECKTIAIVMVRGERNDRAGELRRIGRSGTAGNRRHDVGADRGVATNVRPEPARRRAWTRARQIMPTPRAPAERSIAREPGLRALARGTQVNQATTMTRTPLDRAQRPQQRIPAGTALAAHPRIARRTPTPAQSKNPPGREKPAQGAQRQTLQIAPKRETFRERTPHRARWCPCR